MRHVSCLDDTSRGTRFRSYTSDVDPAEFRSRRPTRIAATAATAGAFALLAAAAALAESSTVPDDAIEWRQLRPGLHLLTGAGSNVVAWSGPDGVVLVDDGVAANATRVLDAVADLAPGGALRFVVNTQWQPDHAGANEVLAQAGAVVIAQENTRTRMREPQAAGEHEAQVPAAPQAALPVVTFLDSMTLHLNGGRLELLHVPAAHGEGDILAWWPEPNVVQLGDLYYAQGYPFVDTARGGSLAGLVAALETVLARADSGTLIVPGHGPVGTRDDLAVYRDMLVAVGSRVRELAEQGESLDAVVAKRPSADWDRRFGAGGVAPDRFVRILYEDLTTRR